MYSIIADAHTHTVACNHAYSTLNENAAAAAEKGLSCLCFTEHGPGFPGGADALFFSNFKVISQRIGGVQLVCGIEVDIMDMEGTLGAENALLKRLDWVIASMHELVVKPGSKAQNTACLVHLAAHPDIHMFGHIDNGSYPVEYEQVVKAAGEHGKILELNGNSLKNRLGAKENARQMLRLCRKHQVNVAVSSDAHHSSKVGVFAEVIRLLQEEDFPAELVLNADEARWQACLQRIQDTRRAART